MKSNKDQSIAIVAVMERKMFKTEKNIFTPADDLPVKFPSLVLFAIVL